MSTLCPAEVEAWAPQWRTENWTERMDVGMPGCYTEKGILREVLHPFVHGVDNQLFPRKTPDWLERKTRRLGQCKTLEWEGEMQELAGSCIHHSQSQMKETARVQVWATLHDWRTEWVEEYWRSGWRRQVWEPGQCVATHACRVVASPSQVQLVPKRLRGSLFQL